MYAFVTWRTCANTKVFSSVTEPRDMKASVLPEDSLFTLAAHEPERTRLILKVAGAGCVAGSGWVLLASWLMPLLAFVPLTIVILALYAGGLVLLTGRAVHAADRSKI